MNNNLKDLDEKLKQFRDKETRSKQKESDSDADHDNMRAGIRAGSELVVTIGAGTLIGLYLDKWLGTAPLFLIIFLLAGIGAGFMNIYRITQGLGSQVGFAPLQKNKKQGKTPPKNDDTGASSDK